MFGRPPIPIRRSTRRFRRVIREFVELDPAMEVNVARAAHWRFLKRYWFVQIGIVVLLFPLMLLTGFSWKVIPIPWSLPAKLHGIIRMAVVFGLIFVLIHLVLIPFIDRFRRPVVLEILREHGVAVCAKCGYRLEGLAGKTVRCPECGHEQPPVPRKSGAPDDEQSGSIE